MGQSGFGYEVTGGEEVTKGHWLGEELLVLMERHGTGTAGPRRCLLSVCTARARSSLTPRKGRWEIIKYMPLSLDCPKSS